MVTPLYTVQLASLTRGWSLTHTHNPNVRLDPDEAPATILADPLTYTWGFRDEQIPAPMDPSTITAQLWSTSGKVAPLARRGDLLGLVIRLGSPAGQIVTNIVFRITEATVSLVPASDYPYRATVRATDLLADLGGWSPQPRNPGRLNGGVSGHRSRLTWIGQTAGLSVGVPSWWPAETTLGWRLKWLGGTARQLFDLVLASRAPEGIHHTVTPCHMPAYPAGWEYAGLVNDGFGPGGSPADPNSQVRYLAQAAGRTLRYAPGLPLRFAARGGRLVLTGPPSTLPGRMPAVSADYCYTPASARQGRETAPNVVRMSGGAINLYGTPSDQDGLEADASIEVRWPTDVAETGPRLREVETLVTIREYDGRAAPPVQSAPLAGTQAFAESWLADLPALRAVWAWDDFDIDVTDMTADELASLVPVLTPAYMDSGRDGLLIRHLTVHSIAPDSRVETDSSTIEGFIVASTLTIAGGRMVYRVTTTPGRPTPAPAGTPITVGEFEAAPYADLDVTAVHPSITLADLGLVDA